MKRFWDWVKDDNNDRVLRLDGAIAEESWYADDVTPALFKSELNAGNGPITVWINSPGGDCVAASQIYNMLKEYPANVTIKIDGMAASAASVIAMAGHKMFMSPTSLMMIHNPLTIAMGDSEEMRKAIQLLDEVKQSIINAYELKTGMARSQLSELMNAETWMNANKAKELGFCDDILYMDADHDKGFTSFAFSRRAVTNCLIEKLKANTPKPSQAEPPPHEDTPQPPEQLNDRVKATDLEKRLSLLQ